MVAPEIKEGITHSVDQAIGESMPQMWERKWRQADRPSMDAFDEEDRPVGPSLRSSIAEKGYQSKYPIDIVHSEGDASLPDAHHRVEVMSRLHPNQFLPVQHHAAMFDLSTTGQWVRDYHEAERKRRFAGEGDVM
jgi:hypothetical protein